MDVKKDKLGEGRQEKRGGCRLKNLSKIHSSRIGHFSFPLFTASNIPYCCVAGCANEGRERLALSDEAREIERQTAQGASRKATTTINPRNGGLLASKDRLLRGTHGRDLDEKISLRGELRKRVSLSTLNRCKPIRGPIKRGLRRAPVGDTARNHKKRGGGMGEAKKILSKNRDMKQRDICDSRLRMTKAKKQSSKEGSKKKLSCIGGSGLN